MPAGQDLEPLRLARLLEGADREVETVRWSPAATTISSGVGEIHGRYVPGSYSQNISTLRSVHSLIHDGARSAPDVVNQS